MSELENNSQTSPKAKISLDSKYVDIFLKLPLGIVGLFYIFGIFVHGFFYGRYNINSLNLFKLTYVLAGFWATVYLILPGVLVCFFVLAFMSISNHIYRSFQAKESEIPFNKWVVHKLTALANRKMIGYMILTVTIMVGTPILLIFTYDSIFHPISFVGFTIRDMNNENNYFFGMQNVLSSLLFVLSIVGFLSLAYFAFYNVKNPYLKVCITVILCWMLISVVISSIDEFSQSGYGAIPVFIGGGKLQGVVVIVKTDKRGAASLANTTDVSVKKQLEENADSDEITFYLGCDLILDTEQGLYVQTGRGTIVLLPKEKILHVIYRTPAIVEPVH
jgi:hypothetical protein